MKACGKLRPALLRVVLAAAGGAGVFLAFPEFDLAPLAWVALAPLLLSARGLGSRGHFWLGWLGGTVTNLGGFWWICGMLMDFGHMSFTVAALLTLLLCAYQGLRFGLAFCAARWFRNNTGRGWWLSLPVAYTAVEFLLPLIFPWYLANSQYRVSPAIQVVELGGVTLLSFLLAMVNGALADIAQCRLREGRWQKKPLLIKAALALGTVLVVFCYGWIRIPQVDRQIASSPKLRVGMVEADVGIWEKEDPRKIDNNLVLHQRLSIELERQGAELIVWPETAYVTPLVVVRRSSDEHFQRYRVAPRDARQFSRSDLPPPENAEDDRRAGVSVEDRVAPQRGFRTPLLLGLLTARANPENRSPRHPGVDFFNSAALLDSDGRVLGMTDKVYLLIFGEYIPFGQLFPKFYQWLPEAGDLTAGEKMEVLNFRGFRLGVMICYEDILPKFTLKAAKLRPQLLVNITNDAWFGKTSEPALHLALAVFRTVENRLGLVRSTNTGISAFVDPAGRILQKTSIYGAETLLQQMPIMESSTPYQKTGDWPAYLAIAGLALGWLLGKKKDQKSNV
jgi:apolipoprotein N-acyltransferase